VNDLWSVGHGGLGVLGDELGVQVGVEQARELL
jgi:hypothetical protein